VTAGLDFANFSGQLDASADNAETKAGEKPRGGERRLGFDGCDDASGTTTTSVAAVEALTSQIAAGPQRSHSPLGASRPRFTTEGEAA
jgi:hypothetical protein